MELPLSTSSVSCKHCHSLVPRERKDEFCCNGCQAVYQILNHNGLSEYYDLKEEAVCFQKPRPISIAKEKFSFVTSKREIRFYVEGVHCSACLWLLEKLPQVMPNEVERCSLNINTSVLTVSLRDLNAINAVAQMIDAWGYTPHLITEQAEVSEKIEKENRKRLLDLGIAGALAGNVMLMSIPLYSGVTGSIETLFEVLSFLLAIPALFYSGRVFFQNVYSGIKTKTFPIDGPILLALLVAFFYSAVSLAQGTHELYFDSLTALIFLLLSSRYYLARLRQSSQMNLGVLDFFQAQYSGKRGDRELLKKGEKIPFDGVVRQGEGWCDYSQFSGETDPVRVQPGDLVYAGTVFLDFSQPVWVEVQSVGNETRLAQLLQKVSEAQAKRTHTELTSDRWSQGLLAVVTSIALIAGVVFAIQGNYSEGIKRILALLIVTCPCALALATPLVFTLAMRSLLKKGLLVKDPSGIDHLPEVNKIYFDKTGTLTEGQLKAHLSWELLSDKDLMALYSMVRLSRHPVSRAIERAIVEKKTIVGVMEWESFKEKMGVGLFARSQFNYSLEKSVNSNSDFTESVFTKDGHEICRIQFQDQVKVESSSVIVGLKQRGYDVVLLSGDRLPPVRKLAEELDVSYHAQKSPEEKAQLTQNEMMVGDGVNDSLALTSAYVSVAVQGGMEAAIQSSQVYSMKPGVQPILTLIDTSKKVRRTLRQNFTLSTTYNLVGAVLSLTGHMNPLIAAILMPMSALTVFSSSLYRMKERE